eukprot:TRINITY_DN14824_c0_g1_i1.p1 TRINITY_DN14824_c0_g1~~TRINITY_DN14824_c0_g1_i1.p1  ORF type:complete len:678 (-),score=158.38 TRINITY_DN14824_c0_g1_i1:26-1840(-)
MAKRMKSPRDALRVPHLGPLAAPSLPSEPAPSLPSQPSPSLPSQPSPSLSSPKTISVLPKAMSRGKMDLGRNDSVFKHDFVLSVTVHRAVNLISADLNGLSDPYCCVSLINDDVTQRELTGCSRSQTVFKNLNPVWERTFVFAWPEDVRNGVSVKIDVWDYDEGWGFMDDPLGSCIVKIDSTFEYDKEIKKNLIFHKMKGSYVGEVMFTVSRKKIKEMTMEDQGIVKWRNIVEALTYFPVIPTYYHRFQMNFFMPDIQKKECTFFTVQNASLLERAFLRHEESLTIKENGHTYLVSFKDLTVTCKSRMEPPRRLLMAKQLEKWFMKTTEGTWKPFDDNCQARLWQAVLYRLPTLPIDIKKEQYCVYFDKKKMKNVKSGLSLDLITDSQLNKFMSWPVQYPQGNTNTLIELEPNSEEFVNVSNFFYLTMEKSCRDTAEPMNTILKINKIWNPTLYQYWENELNMCKKINTERNEAEFIKEWTKLLWHGTSSTNPSVIYNSTKGWKVNYAGEKNLWGKGLYFSQDAAYSSGKYAYTTKSGTQLLLLAEVIVGNSITISESSESKKFKDAPVSYDCVIGNRHGTWIYVTYESSRAYPTYMIEYHPAK